MRVINNVASSNALNMSLRGSTEAGGARNDLIGHSIACRIAVGPRAGALAPRN